MFRTEHIDDTARGTAFLGAGGGGDPYITTLLLRAVIGDGRAIPLIRLNDLPDDARITFTALLGAPTVMVEKLPGLAELELSLSALEEVLGRKATALMSGEIGGMNGLVPLVLAAHRNLPVVDGDAVGRAVPAVQMTSLSIHGHRSSPVAIASELGRSAVVRSPDDFGAEQMLRYLALSMGSAACISAGSLPAAAARQYAVADTVSISAFIGRAIRTARNEKRDPIFALLEALAATPHYRHSGILFQGKIVDVQRRTEGGFARGTVTVQELDRPTQMTLDFQNEFLIARQGAIVRASMPDLISIVMTATAEPILTETLRYGQRVTVVGASAPDLIRGPDAIAVMGPRVFGYDLDFVPIEVLNAESWRRPG
jgi:DUF917 family protein